MDNEDVQENAGEPTYKGVPSTFWNFIKDFTLPSIAYLSGAALCSYALGTFGLPLWIAVPLGLVAGALFFAFFLFGQGSTVFEINVASAIYLVLLAILLPVLHRAHEVRLTNDARHQAASKLATSVNSGSPHVNPSTKP